MEQLFDTHIARLLLLPTNFRPGRKSWPATNALAYLASLSATKKKSLIILMTGVNVITLFLPH